ncbi:zinc finger C3H1 domain-containing protein-like [Salarias fasciatus]|uniref:zinc finger C3H1 domain-containing protein-like n=1 Tax=Salarias fasciatus TaxID=181472 RepID=UPI0011767D5A|nr:zinc finger C3H1 domain-containing protein [Salarias fasciatus]
MGGDRRPRSKSRDGDHRKSSGERGPGLLRKPVPVRQLRGGGDGHGQRDGLASAVSHTHTGGGGSGTRPHLAAYRADFYHPFLPPLLDGGPPPLPPLPPPPDEQEPPPKPPFADEEEEEEMLLRETCLMSMAHKRVTPTEQSSSGPPSPSAVPPVVEVQHVPRGNLSTVSLNLVSPAQRKFSRGPPSGRAPLMLPRHKAVVVSLGDSDDSDSDGDAGSSQAVFGGLEFMIKEARRTVEAEAESGLLLERRRKAAVSSRTSAQRSAAVVIYRVLRIC